MINAASTTESPEQIKADLETAGYNVTAETTDVTGKVTAVPSEPAAAIPVEGSENGAGETAAESETASTHEQPAQPAPDDKTKKSC